MKKDSNKSDIFKSSCEEIVPAELYQYAADTSLIVTITDQQGRITHVNDVFCEISGYTKDEILGKDHRLLKSNVHLPEFFTKMWRALKNGESWRGEICNKSKGGELYWVDSIITPFQNKIDGSTSYISLKTDITQKKLSEQRVLEEKNTLNFVLTSSKAAIFELDIPNNRIECGVSFLSILGLTSADINSNFEKLCSYIHPEDRDKFQRKLKAHFAGNTQSFNCLAKLAGPDGRILHILYRGKVIRQNEKGVPERFVGTITDLSEQLSVEDLLNRTQQAAKVGSWEYNAKTDRLYWSPIVYEIHGLSPATFTPTIEDGVNRYALEHREIINDAVEKALMTGGSWDKELKIIHANGNEVWVRAIGHCELLDGAPIRIFGTFQDIDQRKKIEIELVDSKKQLDLALEAAGIGIWEYYPNEDKLIWDDFMFLLYGVGPDQFVDNFEFWQKRLLPEDLKVTSKIFEGCLERKENIYNATFRVMTDSGELRYIQARAMIEYNEDGGPERILGLNWDVSKEKEFQGYLIEAKDKAQEATRAKSVFLASMSHEIRTPMNGVLGMLELLSETNLDEDQRDLIKTIKDCSDNLLNIVNDVLDFSKIEAGKLEIEDRAFELHDLLNQLHRVFELTAKKKGVKLSLDIDEMLPDLIVSDSVRLNQVLTNLISNALKFTQEGQITIKAWVNPGNEGDNKSEIHFSVKDSGIGVPQDKLGKLFHSFSQVDGSTTRRFGGSGLGLAISKSLVEKMGGEIKVESIDGRGSIFSFSILAGVEACSVNFSAKESTSQTFQKDISVLVAEDNLTNQKLAKRFFEKIGVEMTLANDGLEVLEKCKKKKYDLILMDVQMPKMDGILATKKLIESFGGEAPKIIAMTANVFKEDKNRCFEAGMIDFLAKPVSRNRITSMLCKYFPDQGTRECGVTDVEQVSKNIINEKQILFEFSEDFDIFCELFEDYLEGSAKMIADIEEAIGKRDSYGLRIVAHTLKGVSSNFYSEDLSQAAFTLESLGEKESFEDIEIAFSKLKKMNELVIIELTAFIKRNASLLEGDVA